MFHIARVYIAAAAVAAALPGAQADERVYIVDLLPPPGEGGFLRDALYPEMSGPLAETAARVGPNSGVAVLPAAPPTALPFMPHFGFSTSGTGGTGFVDGIFYSPAEGLEVTAKPGLGAGVQGILGVTVHF